MSEYGFKKVLSLDEYASYFKNIDPVSQYKMWTTKQESGNGSDPKKLVPNYNATSDRVKAAFVVSDPVDWSDIQHFEVLDMCAYLILNIFFRNEEGTVCHRTKCKVEAES